MFDVLSHTDPGWIVSLLKKSILTILIIAGLIYVGRIGIADFLRQAPTAYVDSVQKRLVKLQPSELVLSREQLLEARSWDPSNPLISEYLGQIALMRSQLVSFSPRLQLIFLSEAIEEFDISIGLRPNSAFLWAARMTAGSWLLESSDKLGRDDALAAHELLKISMAMRRAIVLAPWDPSVLQQIARVGGRHYAELSPDTRVMVDTALGRAKSLKLKV